MQKRVAIEVLKDLQRLDYLDSLNSLNTLKIEKLIQQTRIQDRVIIGQQEQIFNLNDISSNKDSIINTTELKVVFFEKKYKKEKRQKYIIGVSGIVLIVVLFVVS